MRNKFYKKNTVYTTIFRVFAFSLIVYFSNHAIRGDYGLKANKHLENSIIRQERILLEAQKTRKKLEHKVKLMSDGSLEKDVLDEKARYNLNLSRNDEIILFDEDS
ncbi:FtsB family cell division protein [Candidatus Liberibacter americanus]|uniref:Septum formation initiator n=1 Tax=Candidatus Liberibacter americanus str. Sao Paulo TaxID=1261131 RepID=U6B777_9HYPH|nr:septum formation initiator family protein [Candidatus Liberibacter americanus]AHA27691.1 Septum formation initiator [Candidatus Liberibacter americanus str. Sao Paulo]EMS36398.1 putative cell division protein [Candidatus Liberibacter americanus PW_SP]